MLSALDQSDIEKFEAVIDSGEYTGSVHDLINLAQNLDCYDFYPGIDSEEALGRVYICLLYTSLSGNSSFSLVYQPCLLSSSGFSRCGADPNFSSKTAFDHCCARA